MNVYAETTPGNREELLHAWYRHQLRDMVTPLLVKWCKRLELTVPVFTIRKMKTKWGSWCSGCPSHPAQYGPDQKPPLCIEYVILHELIHFFEANHTPRFKALLSAHMPMWEHLKDVLNLAPLGEEVWEEMTE